MSERDDLHVLRELAASQERIFLAERELELLGWLPTSAVCCAIDRLGRERERQSWLLRHWRHRHSKSEDTR